MNEKNTKAVSDAIADALAKQVENALNVARIKGYGFPNHYNIGVLIIASTPLVTEIVARMDDITTPGTVSATGTPEQVGAEITAIVGKLVAPWLVKHATRKPTRMQSAR